MVEVVQMVNELSVSAGKNAQRARLDQLHKLQDIA